MMTQEKSAHRKKGSAPETYWKEVDHCAYCGSDTLLPFMNSTTPNWYRGAPLIIKKCANCELGIATPRPDRNILYRDFLSAGEIARKTVERKLNRPNVLNIHAGSVKKAMEFCQHKPKTLFDMGCGAGTILEAARSLGLEAEANEINLAAVERLAGLGFKVYHGFTNQLSLPDSHYDIVINFDYLEHSYEPFADLKACYRAMADEGVLYVKTLYLEAPDALLKGDAYQLYGSGHFHYFPARTLASMIYSAGFDILDVRLDGLIHFIARKAKPEVPREPCHYNLNHNNFNPLPFKPVGKRRKHAIGKKQLFNLWRNLTGKTNAG